MKKSLMLLFTLCFAAVYAYAQDGTLVQKGQKAPEFSFVSDNGKTINLSDLKGKVVLINFFATWCGPCNAELPVLQDKVWNKYKDNKNFVLLIFGREHTKAEVDKFKASKNFSMPMYPDEGRAIFSKYATISIPRNVIVDKDGNIAFTSIGYSPEEFAKMAELLGDMLK